jgi:hypothetical protein
LQIGLWNVNEKRRLPFVNWWFKKNPVLCRFESASICEREGGAS